MHVIIFIEYFLPMQFSTSKNAKLSHTFIIAHFPNKIEIDFVREMKKNAPTNHLRRPVRCQKTREKMRVDTETTLEGAIKHCYAFRNFRPLLSLKSAHTWWMRCPRANSATFYWVIRVEKFQREKNSFPDLQRSAKEVYRDLSEKCAR